MGPLLKMTHKISLPSGDDVRLQLNKRRRLPAGASPPQRKKLCKKEMPFPWGSAPHSGQKHRSPRSLPRDRFSLFFPFSPSFHPPTVTRTPKICVAYFGEPLCGTRSRTPYRFAVLVPSTADGTICANSLLAFPSREGGPR